LQSHEHLWPVSINLGETMSDVDNVSAPQINNGNRIC